MYIYVYIYKYVYVHTHVHASILVQDSGKYKTAELTFRGIIE